VRDLEALDVQTAFSRAKAFLEGRVQRWDWDEEVDLTGVAKAVFLPVKT